MTGIWSAVRVVAIGSHLAIRWHVWLLSVHASSVHLRHVWVLLALSGHGSSIVRMSRHGPTMHLMACRVAIWLLGKLGTILLVNDAVVLLRVVAERTLSALIILDLGWELGFVTISDHYLLLFTLVLPLILCILLNLVVIVGDGIYVEGLLPVLDAKLLGRVKWLSRFGARMKLGLLMCLGHIVVGLTVLLCVGTALESALTIGSVLRVDIIDVWLLLLLMHVHTSVIVVGCLANTMHGSSRLGH